MGTAATAVKKGTHTAKKAKVWHRTTFKRPTCLKTKRSPKNILKAVKPVITIEDCNTLVFIVHKKADKKMIKKACSELYSIKIKKVNTLITPRGEKKAYVALSSDQDALDVANKIGIM